MPEKNIDLHGSAPDKHKLALLLIDVINDFDFQEADQLLKYARPMARNLLRLKRRAQKAGVPIVYVNDNFGRWKSDFRRTVKHCAHHGRGREIVELLRPEETDYFVLKPKHSGFFSTTLETLLRCLEAQTLILTGIAGNFCVLFTANDAYMHDFNLFVPSDCTASNTKKENDSALALISKFLKADTRSSSRIALSATHKKSQKMPQVPSIIFEPDASLILSPMARNHASLILSPMARNECGKQHYIRCTLRSGNTSDKRGKKIWN